MPHALDLGKGEGPALISPLVNPVHRLHNLPALTSVTILRLQDSNEYSETASTNGPDRGDIPHQLQPMPTHEFSLCFNFSTSIIVD